MGEGAREERGIQPAPVPELVPISGEVPPGKTTARIRLADLLRAHGCIIDPSAHRKYRLRGRPPRDSGSL